MKLTLEGISGTRIPEGISLPQYDIAQVRRDTLSAPEWIHFGCGNIFRGYIARLADDLIAAGHMHTGIIAAGFFNTEAIDKVFAPHDDLCLSVGLRTDGTRTMRVIGSIARSAACIGEGWDEMKGYLLSPSLKMISLTITEKGYAVRDTKGALLPAAEADISAGPDGELSTAMGKLCALLLWRRRNSGGPVAVCSMDNCSHNGHKLRESLSTIAKGWQDKGYADDKDIRYISGELTFPCSMIDKITPAPDAAVAEELTRMGIEDMQPVITGRGTRLAPYVNAEIPEYLVMEDLFPAGKIPLDKAGVYLTDLATVEKTEHMKVCACLNPLHTFLAIFGCLLGYTRIYEEMADEDLQYLVRRLGYEEGLPAVEAPDIISPEDFLKEVIEVRLPNPSLPDTPQRIASDTSQKIPIRFGQTIRAHIEKGDIMSLTVVPLAIAGWLRYLTGIDDKGEPMEISPDQLLPMLREIVSPEWYTVEHGLTDATSEKVCELLRNEQIFGADLVEAGLSDRILTHLDDMLSYPGAVRAELTYAR